VVHDVAAGEHALDVGARRRLVDHEVALLVDVEHAVEQPRVRDVADREEHAVAGEVALLAGDRVLERHRADDAVRTVHPGDGRVELELDLLVALRTVDHDRRGAELLAAVHDGDLRGELRQERRLLHRGVAAADDDDVAVAEEEAVAGRAGGHARAPQLVLAGDVEPARLRTGRDDQRARAQLDARRRLERERDAPSSARTTSSVMKVVPKRSAWARICEMSSGPMMPSAKPGKFSTSVVSVS
jgi:hypothetical protein